MRKIAVVIPKYGLIGGAEQFVAELTSRLSDNQHGHFHVITNSWASENSSITFHKIPIITFPKFLTTLSFAYFAHRKLTKGIFDMVHSHDRIFAADLFTLHGIPHRYWVKNIRSKKIPSLYDVSTVWMEKKLVKEGGCKKFIAVSSLTKRIFLKEYPMEAEKVLVIHPGVHLNDYNINEKTVIRKEVRAMYGIPINEPILVFASMNFEIKGLNRIIDALGRVKKNKGIFRLFVSGKGNIKKYKELAHKAGVGENIIFTGQLAKNDMIRHYLAADIYIMLSTFDTFGMVVLEAMAAGLPVIISSNVGAADLVEEGENGFIVNNANESDSAAEKISLLLNDNTRHKMSTVARATATKNTWDKTVAEYAQIYEQLLTGKK